MINSCEFTGLSIGKLEIIYPTDDAGTWLGLADDKFKPDKDRFVLDSFRNEFPKLTVADVKTVYSLCSRSEFLSNWLQSKQDGYVNEVTLPTYYRSILKATDYVASVSKVKEINDKQAEKAEKLREASDNYRKEIEEINTTYAPDIEDKVKEDPLLYLLTLPSSKMPLTLQLAIEKYTPKSAAAPTQKAYAREMFIKYKVSLLKKYKEKPFDIIKLVDDLAPL